MKKILIFLLAITGVASLSAAKLEVNFSKQGGGWVNVEILGTGGKRLAMQKIAVDKTTGYGRKIFNVSGAIEAIVWNCENDFSFYAHLGISKLSIRTSSITIYECEGNYEYKREFLMGQRLGGITAKKNK